MQKRRSFEAQLTRLSLISALPLLALLLWVMIYSEISPFLIVLTGLLGALLVTYCNYRIHQSSVYQFRRLNNLLDAMIQGDYSMRARSDQSPGALDELVASINGLAQRLTDQRLESVESQLLAHIVIEHIDVAIVALDETNKISFFNPAAKKLLLLEPLQSNANLSKQLAFLQSFSSGHHQVVELSLGHLQGRFNVHVEAFREAGIQHKLLFITDVRTLLRSEERKAWQSLVRVISHEINNSLSPIASISQTLHRLVGRQPGVDPNREDLLQGLSIISERAGGLSQFLQSYKQLAKLPEPQQQMISVRNLLDKIVLLFEQQFIVIETKVDAFIFIDPIQFEQVLINIFKNSMESMAQENPQGVISVSWRIADPFFTLEICDQGGGISNPDNLFVPFYSTKKHGSGIGLVLCRQIIEAHNGHLSISNHTNFRGCCVSIEIPSVGDKLAAS